MTVIAMKIARGRGLQGFESTWGTPLSVRSGVRLPPGAIDRVRAKLGVALAPWAPRIDVVTVRFDDVNGPRGGVDIVCRAKVVLRRMRSIVVEVTSSSAMAAFAEVVPPLVRAVVTSIGMQRTTTRTGGRPRVSAAGAAAGTATEALSEP